jgi:hypothetical protein
MVNKTSLPISEKSRSHWEEPHFNDFRDFQTTFIQNNEGQQTIYPNNNFLTSMYYKCPLSVAWKYFLEAQKIDFSFACKSSSCWTL